MPLAPVDSNGTVLYYEDTGAPGGSSTYVTLFLFHGLYFHGRVFQRLSPYAKSNNLRLVYVNHRDYPGSTPLSQTDLERLEDRDIQEQTTLVVKFGAQIAVFMEYFARTYNIPKMTLAEGKMLGGMGLLGWSMAGGYVMSFLANAGALPHELQEFLAEYLRTVVLLDIAAGTGCGRMPPPAAYHPFRDPCLSLAEKVESGPSWISNYFPPVHDLDDVTPELLASRAPQEVVSDAAKTPTLARMTPEELDALVDPTALVRSSLPFLRVHPSVFRANFERALLDTRDTLPGVRALVLWCDESFVDPVWAAKLIADEMKAPTDGRQRRKVDIQCLRGCNHFPHWDEPERFVALLKANI